MKQSLFDYCIENNLKHLLDEWDTERNGDLTPHNVPYGSKKRVWWRCRSGHQWEAAPCDRIQGNGCPFCANRAVIPGENDLATTHSDIAAQWHPTKNGDLNPTDVVSGSKKQVWWICEKGHEWQSHIAVRTKGHGCPVCSNRVVIPGENDLASSFPEIAAQWNYEKNGSLTPEQVTPNSNKKVWWRCELGHEWQAVVSQRTRGRGCPYCANRIVLPGFNDLQTTHPKVAVQWHPTLNGDLTPEHVTAGSSKKVWWQCLEGHIWQTTIASRTNQKSPTGCPVCAGKVNKKRLERYREAIAEAKLAKNEEIEYYIE